ncbi:LpqB family beta-propeller domain-containing protein [Kitasatospora sp. NPDC058444]|uniref:LpqB family beta-propeller domain-containing protein n=1 Tax=Kitasatospora sp. NPDC058444 TaxID=3346504 RepID=UPI003647D92E
MRGTSNRTEPRLLAVVGALLGALVASGCAAMPDSGGITRVELSQGSADKNLQARVYPVAPSRGAKPRELLTGFLDAVTADEGYDTARKYLTENAAAHWKPESGIRVYSSTTIPSGQDVTDADTTVTVPVSGQWVASVDEKHSFKLVFGQNNVSSDFTFVREKDEWRIDTLPPEVIMNETNFRNSFRQVERFFYTAPDPSAVASGNVGQEVLVADPIYLRRRIDPLTLAAQAVADGPSTWLSPVVRTAFPDGARVERVAIDDGRVAHVQIGGADLGEPMACRRMATQLFYTLADQGKGQVERLELKGQRGACTVGRGDEPPTGPGALAGPTPPMQYYQRADGSLVSTDEGRPGDPVRGVLGKPQSNTKPPLGAVAVSRSGTQAAAISEDGHQVYSVPLSDSAVAMGEPVLSSTAKGGDKEDGFASPSWDGRGDLWVVDRNKQSPRVMMVRGAKPYTVSVEGLTPGQTVHALKISSDGVRVALVVKSPGVAARSLVFGRVVHGGTPQAPTVTINGVRKAAPTLTDVASVSWAEADQLLVLGKEADRTQQLYFISTDGSQSTDTQLQSAESMTTVAASESRGDSLTQAPPVLAMGEVKQADGKPSETKAFRLVNHQWREASLIDKPKLFFYAG